jgi:hypothetical protein
MANNTSRGITYPTSGDAVSPLETVFATMASTTNTAMGNLAATDIVSGTLPVVRGGTGGSTQTTALAGLGALDFGKNHIINGAFDIWQRATLGTSTSSTGYFADRWRYLLTGGTSKVFTQSRQAFTTPGSAPVAGQEGRFFYRIAVTTTGTSYTAEVLEQPIEDVRTFANSQVTVSFYARVASGTLSVTPRLIQNFGTGGSPSGNVTTAASAVTLTTSWQRFTATINVPTIATRTIGTNEDSSLILSFLLPNNTLYTVDMWGVQVEAGAVATNFATSGVSAQAELALAQRYYYRIANSPTTTCSVGTGMRFSTTVAWAFIPFPQTMRVAPSALETAGTVNVVTTSGLDASGTAFGEASTNGARITCTTAAVGASGVGVVVRLTGTLSTSYLGFSAEL